MLDLHVFSFVPVHSVCLSVRNRLPNAIRMSPLFRYKLEHSVGANKRLHDMLADRQVASAASAVPFEVWIVASNVLVFDFRAVDV